MSLGFIGEPAQVDSKRKFEPYQGHTLSRVSLRSRRCPKTPQKSSQKILATRYEVKENSKSEIREKIRTASRRFNISPETLLRVANCESGFDQSKIGAVGEVGLFQYRRTTWRNLSEVSGYDLNINSAQDQMKLTAWAFQDRNCSWDCRRCLWTCYRKQHPSQCKSWH